MSSLDRGGELGDVEPSLEVISRYYIVLANELFQARFGVRPTAEQAQRLEKIAKDFVFKSNLISHDFFKSCLFKSFDRGLFGGRKIIRKKPLKRK